MKKKMNKDIKRNKDVVKKFLKMLGMDYEEHGTTLGFRIECIMTCWSI